MDSKTDGCEVIQLASLGDAFDDQLAKRFRVLPLWQSASPQEALSRSEEHTSELQSLMRISYAVFCLKEKTLQDPELRLTTTRSTQQRTKESRTPAAH